MIRVTITVELLPEQHSPVERHVLEVWPIPGPDPRVDYEVRHRGALVGLVRAVNRDEETVVGLVIRALGTVEKEGS